MQNDLFDNPEGPEGLWILFESSKRTDDIRKSINKDEISFTDALSSHDFEINSSSNSISLALLSLSKNEISHICLIKKGNKVVTTKFRVEFSNLISLENLPISDVVSLIPKEYKKEILTSIQSVGKVFKNPIWQSIILAIKTLRPHLIQDINRLISLQKYSDVIFSGPVAEKLMLEREALGASLDIFTGGGNLREKVLMEWAPDKNQIANFNHTEKTAEFSKKFFKTSSFISNLPKRFINEESAIQHDNVNYPDAEIQEYNAGVAIFKQGERKLEIHYANRNSLEANLGVDLIYYNEFYDAFNLIQYKIMQQENGNHIYRPDYQMEDELDRMNIFKTIHTPDNNSLSDDLSYRLNNDGFFFKLVPNKGLRPASGELIKGMYIPREYMNFLVGKSGPKGPRGGRVITFSNSPRYLTNSTFASLAYEGLIGTNEIESSRISKEIRNFYLNKGRTVLFARESK